MADDAKVSQRYRELATEEPPRALDEPILAAARRSARPWTQRWAVPLSLAAVVVLSVAITLRIQHEQPGIELPEAVPKETAAAAPKAAAPASPAPVEETPRRPKPMARKEPEAFPSAMQDKAAAEKPAASAAAPAPAPASAPAPAASGAAARQAEPAAPARLMAETPERELERIAQLRRDGKHDEADKALAEFRKRYPDYRMTDALRERVERR